MSWGDKCFLWDELGFIDLLFSAQPNPFGTTEAYHSVPPISQQEKQFATYSVFLLIQLHSMNLVLYKHHIFISALCCDSRIKPIHDKFQKALLGNWCQRGRERSHQSLIISLGGENTQGESNLQGSQMLGVQEERCHMSSWGERHVHMCLFALALFICFFGLWFSVPYLLPVSHARFRGSKTSKGKKILNSLHIFTFGDMSISNVVLSTHSTCHPSLGTLVVSFVCSG